MDFTSKKEFCSPKPPYYGDMPDMECLSPAAKPTKALASLQERLQKELETTRIMLNDLEEILFRITGINVNDQDQGKRVANDAPGYLNEFNNQIFILQDNNRKLQDILNVFKEVA